MKKTKKILTLFLVLLSAVCLALSAACGSTGGSGNGGTSCTGNSGNGGSGGAGSSGGGETALAEITGITFESAAFDYDGTEKAITVMGVLPDGVTVQYVSNSGIDAGVYNATANLSGNGYKPLNLSATLTINKINMTGLSLENDSVEYDSFEHSIYITGNPPTGAAIVYTYNGAEVSGVTETGVYTVSATVKHKNYNDFTATATLTIKTTEKRLYSVNNGGTVYFQNDLDGDALYKYTGSAIEKVASDEASAMTAMGGNVYYVNRGLLASSVKSLTNNGIPSKLCNAAADSITSDGTYVYYSVCNTLINKADNGIYKIKADGSETEAVKISTDKAEYLNYYDGYLYYSNAGDGGKLYKTPVTGSGQSVLLDEEKTSDVILDKGVLYYNSSRTPGAAVSKYVISENKKVKLTTDAGKYLVKVGDFIYYVNVDLLTGTLFGKGIYRTSALRTSDSSLPGEKVLSSETDGYSSLMSDGTNLYYYKLNDKHFYKYNTSTKVETDLMANFTPPAPTLSGYANLYEHDGELYYTDPADGNSLYKYNPATKSKSKIIADSVAGVWFNDGYMYYSTYLLTNYALFRTDLATNETVKISSDRYDHLTFDGDDIYCIKVGSLYNNHIYKINADCTVSEKVYDADNLWVADFVKSGDYIYYARNPKVYAKRLCRYSVSGKTSEIINDDIKAQAFTVTESGIFVAGTDYKLYMLKTDGTVLKTVASNVTVNDLILFGGSLYYSSTNSKNTGLYRYDLTLGQTVKISDKNAHGFTVCNGKLYFIQTAVTYTNDYPYQTNGNSENDGKLYRVEGNTAVKA